VKKIRQPVALLTQARMGMRLLRVVEMHLPALLFLSFMDFFK